MTIAHVLNHASTTRNTVTGSVYDQHDYFPQKRRALATLDEEVRRILRGEGGAQRFFKSLECDESTSHARRLRRFANLRRRNTDLSRYSEEQHRALVEAFQIQDDKSHTALLTLLSEIAEQYPCLRAFETENGPLARHRERLDDVRRAVLVAHRRLNAEPIRFGLLQPLVDLRWPSPTFTTSELGVVFS